MPQVRGCESARGRRSIWRRIAVVTGAATLALWLDQAKLVRGSDDRILESKCHEVSVTAVCRLGLGSRIATTAMRPW